MRRSRGSGISLLIAVVILIVPGCKMVWRPPIHNEYAFQDNRDRYSLEAGGVFRGVEKNNAEFQIPLGLVGPGIDVSPYPPRGTGSAFLFNITSDSDRYIKPGMYPLNPDENSAIPRTFSIAEFYTGYNMDDFEPVLGSLFYRCVGGNVNVYSFSDSEMHFTWALEVEEFVDTGSEPRSTGRSSVVDGHFQGEYTFYDVPVTTEHKGYNVYGKFFPLASSAIFMSEQAGGSHIVPLMFGGPDAVTWTWPMSGIDSCLTFNLVSESADSLSPGRYTFAADSTEPGTFSDFFAIREFDFSKSRWVDGSIAYLPTGGYCDVRTLTGDFIDITWSIDVDEFICGDVMTATGNSSVLAGAFPETYSFWKNQSPPWGEE